VRRAIGGEKRAQAGPLPRMRADRSPDFEVADGHETDRERVGAELGKPGVVVEPGRLQLDARRSRVSPRDGPDPRQEAPAEVRERDPRRDQSVYLFESSRTIPALAQFSQ